MNNLPRVVTWGGAAGTRTCDLSVCKSDTLTTTPPRRTIVVKQSKFLFLQLHIIAVICIIPIHHDYQILFSEYTKS